MGPSDSPLELEESQLFEDDAEEAPVDMSCRGGTAYAAGAAAFSDDASASDDDGIVLESECSSSGAGRWPGGALASAAGRTAADCGNRRSCPSRHLVPPAAAGASCALLVLTFPPPQPPR